MNITLNEINKRYLPSGDKIEDYTENFDFSYIYLEKNIMGYLGYLFRRHPGEGEDIGKSAVLYSPVSEKFNFEKMVPNMKCKPSHDIYTERRKRKIPLGINIEFCTEKADYEKYEEMMADDANAFLLSTALFYKYKKLFESYNYEMFSAVLHRGQKKEDGYRLCHIHMIVISKRDARYAREDLEKLDEDYPGRYAG